MKDFLRQLGADLFLGHPEQKLSQEIAKAAGDMSLDATCLGVAEQLMQLVQSHARRLNQRSEGFLAFFGRASTPLERLEEFTTLARKTAEAAEALADLRNLPLKTQIGRRTLLSALRQSDRAELEQQLGLRLRQLEVEAKQIEVERAWFDLEQVKVKAGKKPSPREARERASMPVDYLSHLVLWLRVAESLEPPKVAEEVVGYCLCAYEKRQGNPTKYSDEDLEALTLDFQEASDGYLRELGRLRHEFAGRPDVLRSLGLAACKSYLDRVKKILDVMQE